ncbi:MAG: hypothetical protein GXO64_00855 [Candidatus Micrarchaeota archaeon]|nr:hypothetical protein [Candidatus Micrarchaeota archaeon]
MEAKGMLGVTCGWFEPKRGDKYCCGIDVNGELKETEMLWGCQDNEKHIEWDCEKDDKSCCTPGDCVKDNECYGQNELHKFSGESKDRFVFCSGNFGWLDCDDNPNDCSAVCKGNDDGNSVYFGEDAGEGKKGETGCCGDDAGEFFVMSSGGDDADEYKGRACCDSETDCVYGTGANVKCFSKGKKDPNGKYKCAEGTEGNTKWVPLDGDTDKNKCKQSSSGGNEAKWVKDGVLCEKDGWLSKGCDDGRKDDGYYCCGDDDNEFYIETAFGNSDEKYKACCDKKTDCVNARSECVDQGTTSYYNDDPFVCSLKDGNPKWVFSGDADNDENKCKNGASGGWNKDGWNGDSNNKCCGDDADENYITGDNNILNGKNNDKACCRSSQCAMKQSNAIRCIDNGHEGKDNEGKNHRCDSGTWKDKIDVTDNDSKFDENENIIVDCGACIKEGGVWFEANDGGVHCLQQNKVNKYGNKGKTINDCAKSKQEKEIKNIADVAKSSSDAKGLDKIWQFIRRLFTGKDDKCGGHCWTAVLIVSITLGYLLVRFVLNPLYKKWKKAAFSDPGNDLMGQARKGAAWGVSCIMLRLAGDVVSHLGKSKTTDYVGKGMSYVGEGTAKICSVVLRNYKIVFKIGQIVISMMQLQSCLEQITRNAENARPANDLQTAYAGINIIQQMAGCTQRLEDIGRQFEDLQEAVEDAGSDLFDSFGGGGGAPKLSFIVSGDDVCGDLEDAAITITANRVRKQELVKIEFSVEKEGGGQITECANKILLTNGHFNEVRGGKYDGSWSLKLKGNAIDNKCTKALIRKAESAVIKVFVKNRRGDRQPLIREGTNTNEILYMPACAGGDKQCRERFGGESNAGCFPTRPNRWLPVKDHDDMQYCEDGNNCYVKRMLEDCSKKDGTLRIHLESA